MAESGALPDKVASWLEQQGYPLEMRTARALRERRVPVTVSHYYTDIDTGQQRETDLYARVTRELRHSDELGNMVDAADEVCVVIECKSARAKPWVLFSDDKPLDAEVASLHARRSLHITTPDNRWLQQMTGFSRSYRPISLLDGFEPVGYSLVRALGHGNDDAAYGAMMSVAKAAAGVSEQLRARSSRGRMIRRAIVFPVLLVDAPFLHCKLDASGEIQLLLIDYGTVAWNYQLGPRFPKQTLITVMNPSALPRLVDDMRATLGFLEDNRDV
ncbi:hypothetical protein ACQP0C_27630 [Nocardia sp. CA-129566]|uniref:hypothetical protein n=1 Tax=Nocardia sp. CA-129566 TaxID=3239976 RepID=UPI003D977AEB